jgi:hypothetical protein
MLFSSLSFLGCIINRSFFITEEVFPANGIQGSLDNEVHGVIERVKETGELIAFPLYFLLW